MKKNRSEIESFLKEDMKNHGGHASSWDWEADARFAKFIEHPQADLINQAVYSTTVWPVRWSIIHETGIVKLRLRYLRGLARCGIARTGWTGTGAGGRYELGTGRIRDYWLVERKTEHQNGA